RNLPPAPLVNCQRVFNQRERAPAPTLAPFARRFGPPTRAMHFRQPTPATSTAVCLKSLGRVHRQNDPGGGGRAILTGLTGSGASATTGMEARDIRAVTHRLRKNTGNPALMTRRRCPAATRAGPQQPPENLSGPSKPVRKEVAG